MSKEVLINKMIEMFGDNIVDPTHLPVKFQFQKKLAEYQIQIESKDQLVTEPKDEGVIND